MYYNEYKEPALMPEKNCIFNFYIIFLNPLHVHVSSVPQSVPKVDFDLQYNYAYVSSAFVRMVGGGSSHRCLIIKSREER
jgi:hypothetical protein